ncbi:Gfo/Idh/MocA family oxidoreductase [Flavobacterium sp. ANB]|uniref:Gfo/Idh/MocA family protein n=1 Tax=unclassified Flavobacterium TaxID=196869 RepID=UPI0012B6E187|nr:MULTISPECIES: Gfo/Idh/MocA family oxidoreductase [unclassified Flavobacterium]MBF4517626.1 Gfo/Idh/MocA family oxidoreductase [Flavobacterium sp. ANB]MTD70353.1 gfo/Idh/MocA family oxidoreductase [Flavobacterium sp. LC2016-13]
MNVLIIGLGSIAKKHIIALKAINSSVKLYALRSRLDAENIDEITNIYNLDKLNVVFDFAIISNPTSLHSEYIKLLSDKEINLFIEKPPVSSLDEVDYLIGKIQEKNIKSYVACNLRFHPCINFIKEFLTKNKTKIVNEVSVYCGSYLPDWRPGKDFRTIYSANPEMGGGVHLDLFHELDYIHWLFGTPIKTQTIKRNVSSLNIKAIDYANYILEFESFTANIVLNYYRRDPKRTIEILFEDETITIDLIRNRILNSKEEILFESKNFNMIDTYTNQMEFFIESLNNKQEQMNTFSESIEVLKICLNNE